MHFRTESILETHFFNRLPCLLPLSDSLAHSQDLQVGLLVLNSKAQRSLINQPDMGSGFVTGERIQDKAPEIVISGIILTFVHNRNCFHWNCEFHSPVPYSSENTQTVLTLCSNSVKRPVDTPDFFIASGHLPVFINVKQLHF